MALVIDTLEIKWPGYASTQVFMNIAADQFIKIREGGHQFEKQQLLPFVVSKKALPGCAPQ